MTFFRVYEIVAPTVLLPVSYWLWFQRYAGDQAMVLASLSLPIVFAYVIPGIGTNWLHLWEFNTRLRVGRFRPHHGLVFGTATSLFALISLPTTGETPLSGIARNGFVLGSVLAFWNWLYDVYAIKSGFIKVYTRRQSEPADAAAIATDYAPALFGIFGLCYGVSLGTLEYFVVVRDQRQLLWPLVAACHIICLVAPVLAYVTVSFLRTGESGLRSYERVGHDA